MIWNQWKRAPIPEAELRRAANAIVEPVRANAQVEVELADDRIVWMVRAQDLPLLAERLDRGELPDDWEESIDDIEEDAYSIVVDVDTDADASVLTWNPKSGDNHAAWDVAWLLALRLVDAVGATQVTTSAAALLESRPHLDVPAVTLPLMPLRQPSLLPTGVAIPLSVGRPASIAALHAAIEAHDAWCIAAVQIDPALEQPSPDDFFAMACLSKVERLLQVSPESFVVFLAGVDRVKLTRIVARERMMEGSGALFESAEPDATQRRLLLERAAALMALTLPQDNLPDDALQVLGELAPPRLADGAAEIFAALLSSDTRSEVLQCEAGSDRLRLVADALGQLVSTIEAAVDEFDGDLGAARQALLENEMNELRRQLRER